MVRTVTDGITQVNNRTAYRAMIEDKLEQLLEQFSRVSGVEACCLCRNGELPESTGSRQDRKLWERIRSVAKDMELSGETCRQDVNRIMELNLEPGRIAALIPVRIEEQTALYFMMYAVLSPEPGVTPGLSGGQDAGVSREHFLRTARLLQEAGSAMLQAENVLRRSREKNRLSRLAAHRMHQALRVSEATAEIVQLLDNDGQISEIMEKLLQIMGEHLQADKAQILQASPDGAFMDILADRRENGLKPEIVQRNIPAYKFLCPDKAFMYPDDGGKQGQETELEGFLAVACYPVLLQEGVGCIYLCLGQFNKKSSWTSQEEKFIADSVKILQSILTRRIQKNSLAGSYAALEVVLDNVGCAIYVRDKENGKVLFANRRCRNTFARELQEGTLDGLLDRGMPVGRGSGVYEINHFERDCWYDLFYTEISWVDGRRVSLCSLYDITDKKLYQKRIEQQAYTDFLTGLYNRMRCERDLAWQIGEALKVHRTGALLYLDLDDFKHINDGLGHQYGDVLLKSISHSFQRIREIHDTCYRMGGDEFVIIVPPQYYEQLQRIIKDIRQIFNRPWYLKDADYYCTMSMGIVIFPDEGDSVTDLVKKADIAMYEAKRGGKNRVAYYSENIGFFSGRRLDMEKNMRDATAEGYKEFEVYFQPIINVQEEGAACAGAEALIRWNSSKLGFISPAEFIPLAEYLGLINPIGNHVLLQACRLCRRWNENGCPDYKVNVNLSVVQLLQADIVETVQRVLEETGIAPEHLTLEVTESLAINDMKRMKEILANIKKLGVKIALDDFGTGYSSLNHIREIPFDIIKVDQSFVQDLAEDAYSQSFIKLVAELAETIGVSVCVEGIERSEQLAVLQGMKVKYIQGFYFDRPMKRTDFEKKYVPGLVKSPGSV